MKLNKALNLIFWFLIFQSIGFLIGLQTQENMYPWYYHLNKSSLTPPDFIFPVAWTVLYGVLAVVAWILSISNKPPSRKIKTLFAVQMMMNWAWTPLFFGLHWVTFSALWLIGLTCLNFILIIEARKTHTIVSWLLSPYVFWLVFASYLNIVILVMN